MGGNVAELGYCEDCGVFFWNSNELERQVMAGKLTVIDRHSKCGHILIYRSLPSSLTSLIQRWTELNPQGRRK